LRLTLLSLENDSWKFKLHESRFVISRSNVIVCNLWRSKYNTSVQNNEINRCWKMKCIVEYWIVNTHSALWPQSSISIYQYAFVFLTVKVNSSSMLSTASEFFKFCFDESDNLVQHTINVKKLNILFYAFSGTTASNTHDTVISTKSIITTGKNKQFIRSLLLFSLASMRCVNRIWFVF